MSALHFFNIFSAPLACWYGIGKGPVWVLIVFALAFVIHPIADWVMNNPLKSLFQKSQTKSAAPILYEAPLLLAVPFQMLLLIHAFQNGSATWLDGLYSGALCGLSGGILGIGTAHELIHRSSKFMRYYGQAMLFTINYPHFRIEHLWHHVAVATPEDADTARKGESIYRFLRRSIPQGWMKSWTWRPYRRQMLWTSLTQLLLLILCYAIGGANVLLVFVTQGVVTLLLLKGINYVEHYGLLRNGPVAAHHSWDSLSPLTNFSLFNLGYHSQHHKRATVEYFNLPESSPTWNSLPHGYSAMMVLTLLPGPWMRYMDRQLQKLEDQLCLTGNR